MNKKTLKALKQSIAKWENNTLVENPRDMKISYDDCALCKISNSSCDECPVRLSRKDRYGCQNTPYMNVADNHYEWKKHKQFVDLNPFSPEVEDRKKLAEKYKRQTIAASKREVKFLKSLLPEGEKL